MKTAQKIAVVTSVLTLALVAVGAWVRASGSGLGCPDWPLCHGGVVPPSDIGHEPIIEYTHRFFASVVGLFIITIAYFAWRFYRNAPFVFWPAIILVPLVGIQGLLGAITVWRELPPEIVATHLLTAMLVLSLLALTTVGMFLNDPDHAGRTTSALAAPRRRIGMLSIISLAAFAFVLWIGAYVAKSGAATACEGWPLCNGGVLPTSDDQEIMHMLHRFLAGALVFLLAPLVVAAWRRRHVLNWAGPLAISIVVLYASQVFVGALNVWYTFPEPLTISHTAIAGTLWFALSTGAALSLYVPVAQPARQGYPRTEVTA
jgi:heme A synthase